MVRVRPGVAGDRDALVGLEQQVLSVHAEALPDHFRSDGSMLAERTFAHIIGHPWWDFLVAEVDGLPVGYVTVRLEPVSTAEHVLARLPGRLLPLATLLHRGVDRIRGGGQRPLIAQRRVAFIDLGVVDARYRRHGVADAMVDEAVVWARARSAEDLQYEIYGFNRAMLKFAEHRGLEPFKIRYSIEVDPRVDPASDEPRVDQEA